MAKRIAKHKVKWGKELLQKQIRRKVKQRLTRVGSELRRHIVRKLREGKTRTDGPSEPYTPPHVDTGLLMKSIFSEVFNDGLSVRVGTTVKYGKHLEEGTADMLPRPYLRPSLLEMKKRIQVILSGRSRKHDPDQFGKDK